MTVKISEASLALIISDLESKEGLSLRQEHQLEAYKMLIKFVRECSHDWDESYGFDRRGRFSSRCRKCGVYE